jgi:wobble nucleotide-excising tRNase
MIRKIETINDFGIFKDFDWNNIEGIKDFKEKNIFYGWNYSGKTTISRIFSSLRDKQISPRHENGDFKIVLSDHGSEFTKTNLNEFPYLVQVFNSEYIRHNLKWDTNEDLDAISFDVGENVKIREEIELGEKLINVGKSHNLKLLHHFSHFTAFEKVTKHDELLMILPDAMEEFMFLLKMDEAHYESLKRAIKAL